MGSARSATATVTILFTDVVGSTELAERLGDEGAQEMRRIHFRLLRDAVASHGGREVKNLGDGLMVVFQSALDALAWNIRDDNRGHVMLPPTTETALAPAPRLQCTAL